jgi:uncharacterized protein
MRIPIFLVALLIVSATGAVAAESGDYTAQVEQFHHKRDESLRKNWISLAGLYWLKPGQNSAGSDKNNHVALTRGPAQIGSFELTGNDVTLHLKPGVDATVDGKPAPADLKMAPDTTDDPTTVSLGTLRMTAIVRDHQVGIRVKDTDNPKLKDFHGTQWFPTTPGLRVEAKWVPTPGKKVAIPTVLGTTDQADVPGEAVFTLAGKEYRLDPIQEEPDSLFFIFSDATKGETYPGGRFLYTEMPKDGKLVLDFNKAFSPPCAWTPFATCPLAPKENRLPVRIEAGEKFQGHH